MAFIYNNSHFTLALKSFELLYNTTCVCVWVCVFDSRHDNDAEVQPVPGVPQEGERSQTETSGQDLNERLKCVDTCEGVPEWGMIKFISIGGEGSHVVMKQNEKDRKETAKIKERITKREKRGRMRAQNWIVTR